MYYSKEHNAFFDAEVAGSVFIGDDKHSDLLEGQSLGFEIYADDDGQPQLRDRVVTPRVPSSVTARQCELALLDADLLDDVEAAVAGLDRRSQIEWRTKTVVERGSPLVQQLAESLNIDLDNLFTEAAKL